MSKQIYINILVVTIGLLLCISCTANSSMKHNGYETVEHLELEVEVIDDQIKENMQKEDVGRTTDSTRIDEIGEDECNQKEYNQKEYNHHEGNGPSEQTIGEMDIGGRIAYLENKYKDLTPSFWGEDVDGVITHIETQDKIVALTFDACGSKSDGYDKRIVDFLIDQEIYATLFINSNWINKYPDEFMALDSTPLFEIANHGDRHRPLSVNGKSAYGISGTQNIKEVVEEILVNDEKIFKLTGQRPKYFRSGTAFYDEIAVEIAHELGYEVVNFNILGDAGATFNKQQIINACTNATPGSIIIFHMNRPETKIAEGIIEGIHRLKDEGYSFVKLSDYHNLLR